MRRYFYPNKEEFFVNEEVTLSGDLFKHIFIVCRRREGDGFELLTNNSKAYFVRVLSLSKSEAVVLIKEERQIQLLPKPHLHLVLANPKPAVFEKVVEKSVELGVFSIQPLITENSFFKTVSKLKEKKKRLEKIALHAQQQSGRGEKLVIKEAKTVTDFLSEVNDVTRSGQSRGYVLYEAMSTPLDLSKIDNEAEEVPDVYLVVGGEGGFNPNEISVFESAGFKSISLGGQILRVETACVAGISVLKSRMKLWS